MILLIRKLTNLCDNIIIYVHPKHLSRKQGISWKIVLVWWVVYYKDLVFFM